MRVFGSPILRARCGDCPVYTVPSIDWADGLCPGCGAPAVFAQREIVLAWWASAGDVDDGIPSGPYPTRQAAAASVPRGTV